MVKFRGQDSGAEAATVGATDAAHDRAITVGELAPASALSYGDAIWDIMRPTLRAGETYALPSDWSREEALGYWFSANHTVFVARLRDHVVGTYYLHANQLGGGGHVANCAFMTAPSARGGGVGRAMGAHALAQARLRGYSAMQFNFVVATNLAAVQLWAALGFQVVGVLPGAFRHKDGALSNVLVMHQELV